MERTRGELEALSKDELVDMLLAQAPSGTVRPQKKSRKPFDWSKAKFRHVALHIAYMGWPYRGLAFQEGRDDSVEYHLFRAFRSVLLIPPDKKPADFRYSRAGRTDKGVSATGQIVGVYLRAVSDAELGLVPAGDPIPHCDAPFSRAPRPPRAEDPALRRELDYPTMLNSRLPPEIRVLAWSPAPHDFNARFCAVSRLYRYHIQARGLDIAAMRAALAHLEGEHDFRNFCKPDVENTTNFVREIFEARLEGADAAPVPKRPPAPARGDLTLVLRGTAFLYHQVRCTVGVLLRVGAGLEEPDVVRELLDCTPGAMFERKPIYDMAPPQPLDLAEVAFPDGLLALRTSPRGARDVLHSAAKAAQRLAARAAVAASMSRLQLATPCALGDVFYPSVAVAATRVPALAQILDAAAHPLLHPHKAPMNAARNPLATRKREPSIAERVRALERRRAAKAARGGAD